MKTILILIAVCCLTGFYFNPDKAVQNNHTVSVNVENLKNSKGKVLALLFNKAEGFPGKPETALQETATTINNKKASFSFSALPEGKYAISIVHDENGNGKMDTNFMGIPREGYGASNNAKGNFGPPSFEDAAFQLNRKKVSLQISMRY